MSHTSAVGRTISATLGASFLFASRRRNGVYCGDSRVVTFINHHGRRRCECLDLHEEVVPYKDAWAWQKSMVRRRHALLERDEDHADAVVVLQHEPVYTLGTGSLEKYLNFDVQNPPYDVYRTERGGEVTYHGPGQLVMYPVVNLRYHKMDLNWYLRSLEEVVIQALSKTFSVKTSRIGGLTGVWVGNQKVAAIGIRASRWITYHGLALNVTTDLTPFEHIVPCGLQDRQVCSLSGLLGQTSNGRKIADAVLLDLTHESLLKEFSEVFQLSLQQKPTSTFRLSVDERSSLLMDAASLGLTLTPQEKNDQKV